MKKLALLALSSFSFSALASWSIVSDQSSLSYVSVKNETVAEVNTFKQIKGELSPEGQLQVTLPVSGLETAISIRNERILEHVLKSSEFAAIKASGKVKMSDVTALNVGQSMALEQPLQLTLLNETQNLNALLLVTKLNEKTLMVHTSAPLIVDLTKFELTSGLEKLRQLAGLKSISPIVPVSFTVQLHAH